jgi:hypothetical protein
MPNFNLNMRLSDLNYTNFFTFNHDRNAGLVNGILNSDTFATVFPIDPLFYVVTAVYFDSATGIYQESRYSQELSGSPLILNNTVRGIQIRGQSQVIQDYITEINSVQPTLSLIPGSSVREVHIEPFSNEVQKAYFLMDFVHRCQSFQALLQVDDPGLTGTSVPVINSQYKQALQAALSLNDSTSVQNIVDAAFDSLAQNFGTTRQGLRPAVVMQTFYVTTTPTQDLVVSQTATVSSSTNSTAPQFQASGSVIMSAANAQSYYNNATQRYEIQVQMVATTPGSIGNLPSGAIDTVVSGASGFSTTNVFASYGGLDEQSNLALAEDAMNALSSLDTGTEGGYSRIAEETAGVVQTAIVKSGDTFMMRDYDPIRKKHIGGKVDIYVDGTIERTITQTFAFQFNTASDVKFTVVDPVNLIFRAQDSRLSPSNPIFEMLYNPSQNLGLYNISNSPAEAYDLTGVVLVDYQTIQLSTLIPQPTTLLDDFIEGDYRFISNNDFTPTLQPIIRITSITGEVSGVLDSAVGYTLYQLQDPLLEGQSTIATDYVSINQVNNVPSGASIQVNDELHVLIGEFEEPLNSVGVNTFTINVYSSDRTIEYNGPNTANPDYLLIAGTQTTPVKIVRSTLTNIANGATVSIDYQKDENFTVVYVINDVLQQLQTAINTSKHITADVLVKQSLQNPLNVEATIQLLPNADQATTDSNIRTAYSVMIDNNGIGGSVHQSKTVSAINGSAGVDFVVQPFTRHTLQDGSIRVRDQIVPEYIYIPSLSQSTNAVFLLTQELPFSTSDGGGPSNIFHGVFMDDLVMGQAASLASVGTAVNQAWIIGNGGAVISGYTDNATLLPIVQIASAIPAEVATLTANRVLVSLNIGDNPSNHTFSATYVISGDTGDVDVEASPLEFLTPGSLTLTYRAAVAAT